jgi:uncharacterized protein YraI
MKKLVMAALAGLGALLLPAAANAAAGGYTTADVNMRAGPSTEYPRIVVLPRGAAVDVHGCVRGYTWCDVSFYHERGWVSSRYLDIFYDDQRVYVPYTPRARVPVITFDFGYWDSWYTHYPWYSEYRYRSYPSQRWDSDRNDRVYYPPRRERNDRRIFVPQNFAPEPEYAPGSNDRVRTERRIITNEVIIETERGGGAAVLEQRRRSGNDGTMTIQTEQSGGDVFMPPGQAKKLAKGEKKRGKAKGRDARGEDECVYIRGRCELPD